MDESRRRVSSIRLTVAGGAGSMGERKRFPCQKGSYGEGQGPKGGGKNSGHQPTDDKVVDG